jgi:signal transduction histidine kinase
MWLLSWRIRNRAIYFLGESMKRMLFSRSLWVAILIAFFALGAAHASDQGSAAEAEAMVKKAVAHIKTNGAEKSYEEFTNGTSFKDRDLYISVYDLKGNNLAHGSNPKLVGKNLMGLKDPEGVEFIKMITAVAVEKGKGWSGQYKFINPVTKVMQSKAIYVERVADTWVGVGIYK